ASVTATATSALATLSRHDALPISIYDDGSMSGWAIGGIVGGIGAALALVIIFVQQFISRQQKAGHIDSGATIHRRNKGLEAEKPDRKSTRLNSSHVSTSYAVFCLK